MPNEQPVIITETNADGSQTEFEISAEPTDEASGIGTLIEDVVEAILDDGEPEMTATFTDTDGDGMLDTAAVDTDGDGEVDSVFMDTDGDGMLDTAVADTDGDGNVDMVAVDTDGDGKLDVAFADTDGDGVVDTVLEDRTGDGEFETVTDAAEFMAEASEGLPTQEEISTNSVEFNLGSEAFAAMGVDPNAGSVFDPILSTAEESYSTGTFESALDPAEAEETATADAAREAQAAADEFVAAGDYRAAAEARAEAEELSAEAGDSSMLGVYDAQEFSVAADKQDQAAEYQAEQAEKIAEGDYAGAREAAFNAEWATRGADMSAGGADHAGQAESDQANLEWSVYHDANAQESARSAEVYAAEGDYAKAEDYANQASDSQASAGDFAERADPNSIMQDVDHSAIVDSGGIYDAGTYDASLAAVDTGFDSSMDSGSTSVDTTTDDTL